VRLRLPKIVVDKSLVLSSGIYLTSNILNAAIPFLLLPILTRYLSRAEYGLVGMFQMLLMFFGAFTGMSILGAANRKFFDRKDGLDFPAYVSSCVQIILASTALVLLLVYFSKDQLYIWTGVAPAWMLIAVLASAGQGLIQLRLGQWLVRKRSVPYGVFQVAHSSLNFSLSLMLVIGLSMGLEGRLTGQSVAHLTFGLAALAILRRSGLLKLVWRPDYVRDALAFGLPLIPHLVGICMLILMDRVIVKQLLGWENVGVYVVAVQLAMGLGMVTDAINKAYVPWLYERLKSGDQAVMRRIVLGTYAYFGMALLVALAVGLIGPWFVPWFAGEQYSEAGSIIGWLALGQAFNGMYLMVTNYVFYSERTVKLSLVTLASGATHLGLVYLLVTGYGIEGAAMSFAAAMGLRFLLTWIVAQQQHPMPWLAALGGGRRVAS